MPLPSPSGKEERSKFISRCVSLLSRKGEGGSTAQRVAICNSRWKKSKSSVILTSDEISALEKLMAVDYSADSKPKKKKKEKKAE